jgi:hypothetical protein
MTRVRKLTKPEQEALALLTDELKSPDDLLVPHKVVHALFMLGLAERVLVRVGRLHEHRYRRVPATTDHPGDAA